MSTITPTPPLSEIADVLDTRGELEAMAWLTQQIPATVKPSMRRKIIETRFALAGLYLRIRRAIGGECADWKVRHLKNLNSWTIRNDSLERETEVPAATAEVVQRIIEAEGKSEGGAK